MEQDGVAILESAWKRRSARALLKLLVSQSSLRLQRDQILDVLWPEVPVEVAADHLNKALSVLRRTLEPELPARGVSSYIHVSGDVISVRREGLWVDLWEFEQRANEALRGSDSALYDAAIALYGGELLPENRYDDWAAGRREELAELFLRLLLGAADLDVGRNKPEAAIERLRQVVQLDPTREEAHRRLMQLYANEGRWHRATLQYRACVKALSEELGVDPATETTVLYEEIATRRQEEERPATRSFAHPTNLPVDLTAFIGREREIDDIVALLQRPDVRLVTLTGPGGIGKSRLALAIGEAVLEAYPDGVFVVPLASLSDPQDIPSAIAGAVGFKEEAGRNLADILVAHLRTKCLLLILDNVEHLPISPIVASLLATAPSLRILATGRSQVHFSGEHRYAVPGLSYEVVNKGEGGVIRSSEAVDLFVARARALKADFALTVDNAPIVDEICRRLDGMPLAIELAAARIPLFPPAALLGRLGSSLAFLATNSPHRPTRQQTLENTMSWSYSLLSPAQRVLFSRLSVFRGGGSLEAIEAVCNPRGDLDVLGEIAGLVDQSLLRQTGDLEPRFVMLETIRQFAATRLAESDELADVREAHIGHFLNAAARASKELHGPEQTEWLDRLEAELDNFRTVMDRLLVEGRVEDELRMAGHLYGLWFYRGRWSEGRRWLDAGLAAGGPLSNETRAAALRSFGNLASAQEDTQRALPALEEALVLYRELGDRHGIASVLNCLGLNATARHQLELATESYEESVRLYREIDERALLGQGLCNLAYVAMEQGKLVEAEEMLTEALALFQADQIEWGSAFAVGLLADVALYRGNLRQAEILYQQSLETARAMRSGAHVVPALLGLAMVMRKSSRADRARDLLCDCLELSQEVGYHMISLLGLHEAAILAVQQNDSRQAVMLKGAEDAHRERLSLPRIQIERIDERELLPRLHSLLDPNTFQEAWERGCLMDLDRAVALALATLSNS